MRIVVALGGRRFSCRHTTWDALRANVRAAALALAPIASGHQLAIVYAEDASYDNALGRLIEQELGNLLPFEVPFATLQMMIEVDADDSSADRPTPVDIFELNPIRWLLDRGTIVICAGGGAATVYTRGEHRRMSMLAAEVDVDRCAELLARKLGVDLLVLTDEHAPDPALDAIRRASPQVLAQFATAAGPMGDKLRLACSFVAATGASAALGSIDDARRLVAGTAGLTVVPRGDVVYAD
jgi:carbamate kinase